MEDREPRAVPVLVEPGHIFQPPSPLTTAVLFLVFNRPDTTAEVFKEIRRARPPRLYLAADGPRSDKPGEVEKCAAVRAVVSEVDWPCTVRTLLRSENLGCKRAVSSALDWFFGQEDEGIVLEDDCLPAQSFFWYCQELLETYRSDMRVWQICGSAFLADAVPVENASYRFSRYGPVWGWASWRRAWRYYDADLTGWPAMRTEAALSSAYRFPSERIAKRQLGDRLHRGEIDTWDYQWGFAKSFNHGLSIIPAANLVVNIGFGPEATRTMTPSYGTPRTLSDLIIPLRAPQFVLPDAPYDQRFCAEYIGARGPLSRIARRIGRRIART